MTTVDIGPSEHPGAVEFRCEGWRRAVAEGLDPIATFVYDPDGEAAAIEAWDQADAVRQAEEERRKAEEPSPAEKAELARLETEVAEARERVEAAEPLMRRHAFAEAGVSVDGVGEYLAKAYEGDLEDHTAIRAYAIELGFVIGRDEHGRQLLRLPKEK